MAECLSGGLRWLRALRVKEPLAPQPQLSGDFSLVVQSCFEYCAGNRREARDGRSLSPLRGVQWYETVCRGHGRAAGQLELRPVWARQVTGTDSLPGAMSATI
jgi:hypothetical protein